MVVKGGGGGSVEQKGWGCGDPHTVRPEGYTTVFLINHCVMVSLINKMKVRK